MLAGLVGLIVWIFLCALTAAIAEKKVTRDLAIV